MISLGARKHVWTRKKRAIDRLRPGEYPFILAANVDEWFTEVVRHHGLELISLSVEDAMRAPSLPDIHRDPCDRFILAAALRLGVAVVTDDKVFAEYGVRVIG